MVGMLVLAGCLASTFVAYADEGEERARALFKQGVSDLQKGAFESALDHFQSAYKHWRNAKILLNIATTLRQLGRLPEAGDAYELYLADPGADPKKVPEVEKALSEIDAKIGRLVLEVPVQGATVTVDGEQIRLSPAQTTGQRRLRLRPGNHEVEVRKPGYEAWSQNVNLTAGKEKSLVVSLDSKAQTKPTPRPQPPPAPEAPAVDESLTHDGQLALFTRADIDGKFRGAVGVLGVGYGLGSILEPQVAALVGRDKGVEVGSSVYLGESMIKPMGYVGVPVFFVDGASPGVHGAVGVQVDPAPSFGAFVQVGVAAFLNVPQERESAAFVPSAGIQGRM